MTVLWIATANPKKRIELDRLLNDTGLEFRTMADLPEPLEIIEDGVTFADNAAIKASVLTSVVGEWAIGDDSGLSVDALDGRPGVLSARYAGPDADDAARNAKLLSELADASSPASRRAHFTCNICLASPEGVLAQFEQHCHGWIADAPRGDGGFGYDPVSVSYTHLTLPTKA